MQEHSWFHHRTMKTVTTEIRLARLSDAATVAEVHDEAWRSAYQG